MADDTEKDLQAILAKRKAVTEKSDDLKGKKLLSLSESESVTSSILAKATESHHTDLKKHPGPANGDNEVQEEEFDSDSAGKDEELKKKPRFDPKGKSSYANGKGKEVVMDKGKGKMVVESESEDDSDSDARGSGSEDEDSDFSDDPLLEVDPANILPSWTRRRTAHSGSFDMAGNGDDDDDDDDKDDEDEDDDGVEGDDDDSS